MKLNRARQTRSEVQWTGEMLEVDSIYLVRITVRCGVPFCGGCAQMFMYYIVIENSMVSDLKGHTARTWAMPNGRSADEDSSWHNLHVASFQVWSFESGIKIMEFRL